MFGLKAGAVVSSEEVARMKTTKTESDNASDLKSSGLKATPPRLKILNIFQISPVRHHTAEDLYKILLAEDVEIGLSTVYRVLTQFERAGLLKRNILKGGKAVFELNEGLHHDHIVCLDCGLVEEFYDKNIEKNQQKIAKKLGFKLAEHALSLYGHCTKKRCPHKKQINP